MTKQELARDLECLGFTEKENGIWGFPFEQSGQICSLQFDTKKGTNGGSIHVDKQLYCHNVTIGYVRQCIENWNTYGYII